jgi:hypothetical protein
MGFFALLVALGVLRQHLEGALLQQLKSLCLFVAKGAHGVAWL